MSSKKLRTGKLFLLSKLALIFSPGCYSGEWPDDTLTIYISPDWSEINDKSLFFNKQAFSSEQLDKAGVSNTKGLPDTTSGLVLKSSAGLGDAYLRGVGGTTSAAGEAGVGTFIDGIYLPSTAQSLQDFYDVTAIEVVKGPYGTRFSRNLIGGGINIQTRDPDFTSSAYADVLFGSYNNRHFRAAVNQPVIANKLSFRLAGALQKRDGYSYNDFLDKELDDQDNYGWRAKLRYQPSADLDVVFGLERSHKHDTSGLAKHPDVAVGANGGLLLGGTAPDNPRHVNHNADEFQNIESDLYSIRLKKRLKSFQLSSNTAFQDISSKNNEDLDSTEINFSTKFLDMETDSFSQEFRLDSSASDDIGWCAGLFFLYKDSSQNLDGQFPLFSVINNTTSNLETFSYALFGEITHQFSQGFNGAVSVRYNYEETELDLTRIFADPFGVSGPAGTTVTSQVEKKNWHGITPEIRLNYEKTPSVSYYGRIARGFKAGGFNAYQIQSSFSPEYLRSYEAGVSLTDSDREFQANASVFHYDYEDKQLFTLAPGAPPGTALTISNAARASVTGLDLQISYRPTNSLRLGLAATLMRARFDDFVSVDPNNPAVNPDRSGGPMPQAPDVSVVLSGQYNWLMENDRKLSLSAYYKYQSTMYFNPYEDEAVKQNGFGLLNANLDFRGNSENWFVGIYGQNLTDELYAQNIIRVDPVMGTVRLWGRPRTFGMRFGINF